MGLDFYKRPIDGLLEKGIKPWATLYHWDLPSALERKGGWRNRDTAAAFADYAAHCVTELDDRVKHWITHNEPWCVAVLGHRTGEHAPGLKDPRAALETARYPQDMMDHYAKQGALGDKRWEFMRPGDLATIAQPLDFLGVNFYSRAVSGDRGPAEDAARSDPLRYTGMGWEIHPEDLQELFVRLAKDYPAKAYYITENGAAYDDALTADKKVNDPHRLRYYALHLDQVAQVCARNSLEGLFCMGAPRQF